MSWNSDQSRDVCMVGCVHGCRTYNITEANNQQYTNMYSYTAEKRTKYKEET
jgi:hypothetical protein